MDGCACECRYHLIKRCQRSNSDPHDARDESRPSLRWRVPSSAPRSHRRSRWRAATRNPGESHSSSCKRSSMESFCWIPRSFSGARQVPLSSREGNKPGCAQSEQLDQVRPASLIYICFSKLFVNRR